MNDCAAEWAGTWGDEYTMRNNRVDWQARVPFWREIVERTGARSVYEYGCNAGWNLSAIRRAFPDVRVAGHDLNSFALKLAANAGLPVCGARERPMPMEPLYDLSFTAGVLIHVPPVDVYDVMQEVMAVSSNYVLAVEYASDKEEEVNYRGREGMLWRRPYGKMYEEIGLKTVAHGHAGDGFDNCHYWLMRRP